MQDAGTQPGEEDQVQLTLSLPGDLARRLQAIAESRGETLEVLVRVLLDRGLASGRGRKPRRPQETADSDDPARRSLELLSSQDWEG